MKHFVNGVKHNSKVKKGSRLFGMQKSIDKHLRVICKRLSIDLTDPSVVHFAEWGYLGSRPINWTKT